MAISGEGQLPGIDDAVWKTNNLESGFIPLFDLDLTPDSQIR